MSLPVEDSNTIGLKLQAMNIKRVVTKGPSYGRTLHTSGEKYEKTGKKGHKQLAIAIFVNDNFNVKV